MTSNRLLFSGPTFWEDTDRGNLNIYYTSDQDQIDDFKKLLYNISEIQLKQRTIQKYQFKQKNYSISIRSDEHLFRCSSSRC